MVNEVILLSISPFLDIKEIRNTCRHLNVDSSTELKMFKMACLEQLSLTDEEKRSIQAIEKLPPLNLKAGLFLKVYRPHLLKKMIINNDLLDPRTKVQLLSHNFPKLFDWFIDQFIESKPLLCKIGNNLRTVFDVVSQEKNRQLRLDDYLFMCVGNNSIRCYNVHTNQVVGFAIGDTLYYLQNRITNYFCDSFVFKTLYSIYKFGEGQYISDIII